MVMVMQFQLLITVNGSQMVTDTGNIAVANK